MPSATAAETLHGLIQACPIAVMLLDFDGTVRLWNPAAERIFGWPAEEVLGRILPIVPEDRLAEFHHKLSETAAGRPFSGFETLRRTKSDNLLDVALWTVPVDSPDGVVRCLSLVTDNSERKRDEAEREALLLREQAARRAAERAAARLSRLQGITAALSQALTVRDVAAVIVDQGTGALGAAAGALVLRDGDDLVVIRSTGYTSQLLANFERFQLAANVPLSEAVRTSTPVWLGSPEERSRRYPALDQTIQASPYRAWAAVPLRVEGEAIGGLGLSFAGDQTFPEDDQRFLETIAAQCSQAFQRAQLYENERSSRRRLEVALDTGRMGTWEWDLESNRVRWSEQLEAIHGLAPGTFAGTFEAYASDIHPGDRERVFQTISSSLQGHEHHLEYRIIWPDGSEHWVEARGRASRDAVGRIVGLHGVCQDVTERRRNEDLQRLLAQAGEVLASSLDYATTLGSVAHLAVPLLADWCIVDLLVEDGRCERVEVAAPDPGLAALADAVRRFPYDPQGTSVFAGVLRTRRPDLVDEITDEWIAGYVQGTEHRQVFEQVAPRTLFIAPLVARGRALGTITFIYAGSGRRHAPGDDVPVMELARRCALAIDNARLYEETRAAREAAEDAVRLRDEFLSIASHELRNPVAGVKGAAQFLRRIQRLGRLDVDRLERHLTTIEQTSNHLATLTEDLLDVSRLQRGTLPLRPQPTDLARLVADAVDRTRSRAPRHPIAVYTDDRPHELHIDPDRIEQIITNLLDNAVKYTPDGGEIRVDLEPLDRGVVLRVTDPGIGLPQDATERIFEPFGRAPNAAERNIPGLGLGLYICRRIAEQHGGWLWAESAGPGTGTTLSLWLPLDPPASLGQDGDA